MEAGGALRLSPLRRGLAIDSTVDIFTFYVPHRHVFFFFQAEDGIRDLYVTEVQTCALPIYAPLGRLIGRMVDTQAHDFIAPFQSPASIEASVHHGAAVDELGAGRQDRLAHRIGIVHSSF